MIQNSLISRNNKLQLYLDLAVPRDIENNVKIDNSYIFNVDDLRNIIDENQLLREKKAKLAEEIVDHYNEHYHEWIQIKDNSFLIKKMRNYANAEKEKLKEKAIKKIKNNEDPELVINELSAKLTKKLMHHPSILVRYLLELKDNKTIDIIDSIYSNY